jgi:hypothetical protein
MLHTLFLLAALAASSPAGGTLVQTTKSPSGAVVAEEFMFQPSNPRTDVPRREIWLRDSQGKNPPSLLFEHYRQADVLFSPNDKWVSISDYWGSGTAEVRLFQKTSGLKYSEMKKAEPTKKCWALLDRTIGRSVSEQLAIAT